MCEIYWPALACVADSEQDSSVIVDEHNRDRCPQPLLGINQTWPCIHLDDLNGLNLAFVFQVPPSEKKAPRVGTEPLMQTD